jgi:hypothetical protein
MAKVEQYGELIPKGAGDPIPLLKKNLLIGRRESCDIVLRFGNISAHHCEMTLESGYWFVKDLNSQNGTRVNGYRVTKRRLDPNDVLSVAKFEYSINYVPAELGGRRASARWRRPRRYFGLVPDGQRWTESKTASIR